MLSHVTVGVALVERALGFYEPLMRELKLSLKFADRNWALWIEHGNDRPIFMIASPFDGQPASPGNGQMVAFMASSREQVDRCHDLSLRHGGTSEGPPGPRPQYHPNYYGAYFRDLDGNKLCVCCHQAVDFIP